MTTLIPTTTTLPFLQVNQPVYYQENSHYKIKFYKSPDNLIYLNIFIYSITQWGLLIDLYDIFKKILTNLQQLGIPLLHDLYANILVQCLYPPNRVRRIIRCVACKLNNHFPFYKFSYQNFMISYFADENTTKVKLHWKPH
jgi:hypothetical protein